MRKNNLTLKEASDFFDEHDLEDFSSVKEVKEKFKLPKKKYIGVDLKLFSKIEKLANKTDLSIEEWVNKCLQKNIHLA